MNSEWWMRKLGNQVTGPQEKQSKRASLTEQVRRYQEGILKSQLCCGKSNKGAEQKRMRKVGKEDIRKRKGKQKEDLEESEQQLIEKYQWRNKEE